MAHTEDVDVEYLRQNKKGLKREVEGLFNYFSIQVETFDETYFDNQRRSLNSWAFPHLLISKWPDMGKVWDYAVRMCPLHRLNQVSSITHKHVNYLIVGLHEFAITKTPIGQLEKMYPLELYERQLVHNKNNVTLESLQRQLTLYRQEPDWTNSLPAIQWQLLQTLCRVFIERLNQIGKQFDTYKTYWQSLVEYVGYGVHESMNRILRTYPDILRVLKYDYGESFNDLKIAMGSDWKRSTKDFQWYITENFDYCYHLQWGMVLLPPLPLKTSVWRYTQGDVTDFWFDLLKMNGIRVFENVIRQLSEVSLTMNGFTSTSMNLNYVLYKMMGVHGFMMEIRLPAGTHCTQWPSQEYEIILPHRCEVKLVDHYTLNCRPTHDRGDDERSVWTQDESYRFNRRDVLHNSFMPKIHVLVFDLTSDGLQPKEATAYYMPLL